MSSTASTLRGLSTFTAIALLGSPKIIHLRSIELDTQLYLGGDALEHLFGILKFYNANNIAFDAEQPGLYLIEASFVQVPEKAGVVPYSAAQYDFCGDLLWAIPLGKTTLGPSFRPYAHIAGLATNCNVTDGTWNVDIEPYVSATIKTEPGTNAAPLPQPRAPFFCHHPEPHGKGKKKPTPFSNRFVAVHGHITDVIYKAGSDTIITAFKIAVDNIEFLGAEPPPSSSSSGSTVSNKLDSPVTTPGFGKAKGKSVAKLSRMPETPTPTASGSKRGREDDEHREQPAAARVKKAGSTSAAT
ncbi:hypothetical protein B0H34DRAFT_808974 [Crassisporium funariophilum]|nr:hypothetical protein B0H34DRAFT_808974 [Crassisporium funariophilum]